MATPEIHEDNETPAGSNVPEDNEEEISDKLFQEAMFGNWRNVIRIYETKPYSRKAWITRSKDTVLHLAVSEGNTENVQKLLNSMKKPDDNFDEILSLANESGSTPLHLAAALGMEEICELLASKCPKHILRHRNEHGETPLFVAVQQGKRKVFLKLHKLIDSDRTITKNDVISCCRRSNGDTILHRAIFGEFFELANEIIGIFPELVNFNNERGESPLHVLAGKPSAFRSGTRNRGLDRFIYASVIIDPLESKYPSIRSKFLPSGQYQDNKMELPHNYEVCFTLYSEVTKVLKELVNKNGNSKTSQEEKTESNDEITIEHVNENGNSKRSQEEEISSNVKITIEKGEEKDKKKEDVTLQEQDGIRYPKIYFTCFNFLKIILKVFLIILGIGIRRIDKIKRKKQKHIHANQVMKRLVKENSSYKYDRTGTDPGISAKKEIGQDEIDKSKPPEVVDPHVKNEIGQGDIDRSQPPEVFESSKDNKKGFDDKKKGSEDNNKGSEDSKKRSNKIEKATPILLAAKMGIVEMVKAILETFPVAIQDMDSKHRNIVLLAAAHRQTNVYRYMMERKKMKESIFGKVDKEGNSAVHLAASTLDQSQPWGIPGAALQMHWEIKWYKFVKNSMEPNFFVNYNKENKTSKDIFTMSHKELVKEGGEWLNSTSNSCTVVAALIATIAFASATTVPGGLDQTSGYPILEGRPAFTVFAASALVALCFSVTALVVFLSILTSRSQERDFANDLPVKLIVGLTALFMSIAAMLIAFCGGYFFVMEAKFKYFAFPIYAVICLPVSLFAMQQFPLYVDLINAIVTPVPERAAMSRIF